MFPGRSRASDTAGRASPTFVRSGNSFFAKIFVFLAFSVQGGLGSSDARATGGTITTFGDYVIHTFTSGGEFANADSTLTEVEVLVVGGGGGGGVYGGGGGGGAVVSGTVSIAEASYSVMVGEGGDSDSPGGTSAFASLAVASGGSWDMNEIGPGGRSGTGSPWGGGGNPGATGVICSIAGRAAAGAVPGCRNPIK